MNIELVFFIKKILVNFSDELSNEDFNMIKGIIEEIQEHNSQRGVVENEYDRWIYDEPNCRKT